MNALSEFVQPTINPYGESATHSMDHNMHSCHRTNGSSSGPGFALLQGHIQLMAMVPTLPENQTSPRLRPATQQQSDDDSLTITPRMMPSATKFKRPHLPSILAGKASRVGSNGFMSYGNPFWQPPRSHSNLSLPPKNSQPVTMPSFAKCLPGTRKAMGSAMYMNTQQFESNNSCFPIIPNQPSYHTLPMINLGNKENYASQPMQLPTSSNNNTFANPYTDIWLSTNQAPGYQMINVVPLPNGHSQQQHIDFPGGSGDHAMAPVIHQVHPQQTFEQVPLTYPFQQQQQQQAFPNDVFQYVQQPPYAVQSMPNFATPRPPSNSFAIHNGNYPFTTTISKQPNGFSIAESSQPIYSASMPEICLNSVHPHYQKPTTHHHHRRDNAQVVVRRSKKGNVGIAKGSGRKEVAIVVEDSSSSSSTSCSESDENENEVEVASATKKATGCKSISVVKLREIQKEKKEKREKEEAKYASLGPESTPEKIPSNPRVAHTPVTLPKKPDTPKEESKSEEKCTNSGVCCSHCKCCTTTKPEGEELNSSEQQATTTDDKPSLNDKVKEMRGKLTPRRKVKPVVVAVHDCFPSDSSISEAESEVESCRRSCFNYVGNNGAMIKKRKPTINAIMKTKLKGDSSEVFDDLHTDLNPDEARTYTCEYLVELLTSEDWNNCYTALQIMVRLARHRPKVLLNYLNGPILWCTFHHITSPKSALCRAAIVTFKELFQRIGSAMENDIEKITEKLVLKSLAPNMFIREECDRALEAMVANCNLVKVLNAMDIVSKRPHARVAGQRLARMALQIVQVAGVDLCLKPTYAEKLLPMLFCFMTEANNGTRTAAKEALGMLMNHLQFETAVTKHVTFDKNCTEVFKKLDKMRGRNRNRRQLGNSRYPLPHFRR